MQECLPHPACWAEKAGALLNLRSLTFGLWGGLRLGLFAVVGGGQVPPPGPKCGLLSGNPGSEPAAAIQTSRCRLPLGLPYLRNRGAPTGLWVMSTRPASS